VQDVTATETPDAVGEGSFTFDGEGNIIASYRGWRAHSRYAVPASQMEEVCRRFWAMHATCARLTEVAASFDRDADESARIAVERWEELTEWRQVGAALGELVREMADAWPDDDCPPVARTLELFDALVARAAVTA